MARKEKKKRLYRKNGRFYGDFRDFDDVGGGQEALIPEGERFATKRHPVAKALGKARLEELRRLREAELEMEVDLRRLGPFVDYHMEEEAKERDTSLAELAQLEHRLSVAIDYFGEDILLRSLTTMKLGKFVQVLAGRERWKGLDRNADDCIRPATQRKYLSSLSKLFTRARAIGVIPSTHRPFSDLMNWPKVEDEEAEWLDPHTAALLLEAARLYRPKRPELAVPCAYTIVATLLLTGMRPAEALGLLIEDINFDRKQIRVRRNRHRRLKNRGSRRPVPLWPQLETILRAYLAARGNPASGLLFPSPTAPGKPVRNITRLIEELTLRIGYRGDLTPKVFRHTYCAARLQTVKDGKPISHLQVARELGHRGTGMVERIYSHFSSGLIETRRKPHVDFLVDDYAAELEERLRELRRITEERNGFALALSNRVPLETELAVLEQAGKRPEEGPRKAAAALVDDGHAVSASGVRWIWKRYELHRAEHRLEAIETGRLGEVMEEVRALRSA